MIGKQEICEEFFWFVRKNFRNQKEAAEHYGVSRSYISVICRGVRYPSNRIVKDMGYKKVVAFVKDGEK